MKQSALLNQDNAQVIEQGHGFRKRKSRFLEDVGVGADGVIAGGGEVSFGQVALLELAVFEIGFGEVGLGEVCFPEIDLMRFTANDFSFRIIDMSEA
jgi:hypothetical protein